MSTQPVRIGSALAVLALLLVFPRLVSASNADDMAHPGFPGALAPENLVRHRHEAPYDLTGTWIIDERQGKTPWRFGPPYPEFYAAGQEALNQAAQAAAEHRLFRESESACWPPGMPSMMTQSLLAFVQKPTAIYIMAVHRYATNGLRTIFLDGRAASDPTIAPRTFNGESIGRWDGQTLVVHTTHMDPEQHWIDDFVPVSEDFEITERMRLIDHGTRLRIEFAMTDPQIWKGEWRTTKDYLRQDHSDVFEADCIYQRNRRLPGVPSD